MQIPDAPPTAHPTPLAPPSPAERTVGLPLMEALLLLVSGTAVGADFIGGSKPSDPGQPQGSEPRSLRYAAR
ncbi:MAG: hypothetical protein AAFP86_02660, partial [Planctomycetota bacterium]